jgi:hypothetical protein
MNDLMNFVPAATKVAAIDRRRHNHSSFMLTGVTANGMSRTPHYLVRLERDGCDYTRANVATAPSRPTAPELATNPKLRMFHVTVDGLGLVT